MSISNKSSKDFRAKGIRYSFKKISPSSLETAPSKRPITKNNQQTSSTSISNVSNRANYKRDNYEDENFVINLFNINSRQQQNIFNYVTWSSWSSATSAESNERSTLLVKCSRMLSGFNLCRFTSLCNFSGGLLGINILNKYMLNLPNLTNEAFYLINYETNMRASSAQRILKQFQHPLGDVLATIQINLKNFNMVAKIKASE